MKKNDLIELEINSITNLGFGVGRHEGLVIFVGGAVSGDVVLAKIIKLTSSYAVGRVEKFIKTSAIRDGGRCSISACSSCAYKSVSYEYEKSLKLSDVKSAFSKAGLSEVEITELIPSPKTASYRNKAQYPISRDKNGEYVIGFYAPKSHRVTEARHCPLSPIVFPEILDALAEHFKLYDVSVYDESCGTGLLRHVYIRRGEVSGEILITLVINGTSLPGEDELSDRIKKHFPDVVGLLINENTDATNVILGEKFRTIFGRDYINDTLCGVNLKISAAAFYQVNHDAAELLYKKARELAAPTCDDVLLDLYCGAGSIGLSMADSVGKLIGIEIIESAVRCAAENAKNNGVDNAKFYTGDAKGTEKLLDNAERELGKKIEPTIVVLDPPRAGCSEELLRYVANLAPKRIVYISCNPTTLARDAKIFSELGYTCGKVTAVELFPMTGHVESLVCLERRLDN